MGGILRLSGTAPVPVNQIGQQLRTIEKKFAPQKRGKPKPRLRPPTAVNVPPPVLRNIYVSLAEQRRSKPPKPKGLSEPTVVNPFVPPILGYTDKIVVSLAPQRRGRGYVVLVHPIVVFGTQTLGGTMIIITVPRRRTHVRSELRPPEV